jgi:hypothetical protein
MYNITDKFYYKDDISNLLELERNEKYSLLFIYFKLKDIINDKNFKKVFYAYGNLELVKYNKLEKENRLIDYIYKHFTLKYRFYDVDKGKIVKNIII